jgi:hypothetical protein
VICCGNFSKTLVPVLSLGLAVIPAAVVPTCIRAGALARRGIDTFNQLMLVKFMRHGLLAPAHRRMCAEYSRRRDALQAALSRHASSIRPVGGDAEVPRKLVWGHQGPFRDTDLLQDNVERFSLTGADPSCKALMQRL